MSAQDYYKSLQKKTIKLKDKPIGLGDAVSAEKAVVVPVRGDGNCAFRAIVQSVLLNGVLLTETTVDVKGTLINGQDKALNFLNKIKEAYDSIHYAELVNDRMNLDEDKYTNVMNEYAALYPDSETFETFFTENFPDDNNSDHGNADGIIGYFANCLRELVAKQQRDEDKENYNPNIYKDKEYAFIDANVTDLLATYGIDLHYFQVPLTSERNGYIPGAKDLPAGDLLPIRIIHNGKNDAEAHFEVVLLEKDTELKERDDLKKEDGKENLKRPTLFSMVSAAASDIRKDIDGDSPRDSGSESDSDFDPDANQHEKYASKKKEKTAKELAAKIKAEEDAKNANDLKETFAKAREELETSLSKIFSSPTLDVDSARLSVDNTTDIERVEQVTTANQQEHVSAEQMEITDPGVKVMGEINKRIVELLRLYKKLLSSVEIQSVIAPENAEEIYDLHLEMQRILAAAAGAKANNVITPEDLSTDMGQEFSENVKALSEYRDRVVEHIDILTANAESLKSVEEDIQASTVNDEITQNLEETIPVPKTEAVLSEKITSVPEKLISDPVVDVPVQIKPEVKSDTNVLSKSEWNALFQTYNSRYVDLRDKTLAASVNGMDDIMPLLKSLAKEIRKIEFSSDVSDDVKNKFIRLINKIDLMTGDDHTIQEEVKIKKVYDLSDVKHKDGMSDIQGRLDEQSENKTRNKLGSEGDAIAKLHADIDDSDDDMENSNGSDINFGAESSVLEKLHARTKQLLTLSYLEVIKQKKQEKQEKQYAQDKQEALRVIGLLSSIKELLQEVAIATLTNSLTTEDSNTPLGQQLQSNLKDLEGNGAKIKELTGIELDLSTTESNVDIEKPAIRGLNKPIPPAKPIRGLNKPTLPAKPGVVTDAKYRVINSNNRKMNEAIDKAFENEGFSGKLSAALQDTAKKIRAKLLDDAEGDGWDTNELSVESALEKYSNDLDAISAKIANFEKGNVLEHSSVDAAILSSNEAIVEILKELTVLNQQYDLNISDIITAVIHSVQNERHLDKATRVSKRKELNSLLTTQKPNWVIDIIQGCIAVASQTEDLRREMESVRTKTLVNPSATVESEDSVKSEESKSPIESEASVDSISVTTDETEESVLISPHIDEALATSELDAASESQQLPEPDDISLSSYEKLKIDERKIRDFDYIISQNETLLRGSSGSISDDQLVALQKGNKGLLQAQIGLLNKLVCADDDSILQVAEAKDLLAKAAANSRSSSDSAQEDWESLNKSIKVLQETTTDPTETELLSVFERSVKVSAGYSAIDGVYNEPKTNTRDSADPVLVIDVPVSSDLSFETYRQYVLTTYPSDKPMEKYKATPTEVNLFAVEIKNSRDLEIKAITKDLETNKPNVAKTIMTITAIDEIVTTAAPDASETRAIAQCSITDHDSIKESALFMLQSYKDFTEKNRVADNQKYEIVISDFNSTLRAEKFLLAYLQVFMNGAGVIENDLQMIFSQHDNNALSTSTHETIRKILSRETPVTILTDDDINLLKDHFNITTQSKKSKGVLSKLGNYMKKADNKIVPSSGQEAFVPLSKPINPGTLSRRPRTRNNNPRGPRGQT